MLASVLVGDGHRRIAIARESSLIGKEYLHYAERAYVDAGFQLVATVAIPQVEADKGDAVAALREAKPDAIVHVGFGHGLWGFNDALSAANWDPPRYTTTAFEMAHINEDWMRHLAGWIGLDSYDERNEVGQAFLDRFAARYGRRPGYFMPWLCHDVATVIAHGLGGGAAADRCGREGRHGGHQAHSQRKWRARHVPALRSLHQAGLDGRRLSGGPASVARRECSRVSRGAKRPTSQCVAGLSG